MKRLSMLVTSDGRWVLEDSAELAAELGDPKPDYDAALFAVKNLGFIRSSTARSSRSNSTLATCSCLHYLLSSSSCCRQKSSYSG